MKIKNNIKLSIIANAKFIKDVDSKVKSVDIFLINSEEFLSEK